MFRFIFFGVFGGDFGAVLIWSGRSAVFRFVQGCSDLFRVVRGVEGVAGCEWATVVFRFIFFGVFGGDSGVAPIWSERSAVFRFVQLCSDLFRVVRGVEGVGVGRHCDALPFCYGVRVARFGGIGGARRFLPAQE